MQIQKELDNTCFRHELASCLKLGETDYVYIPVPKNASSFVKYVFNKKLHYNVILNYNDLKNKKYLVCVRDPYERWFSGIVEYIYRYFPNNFKFTNSTFDFIFEKIIFDEHTEPQVNFLNQLNTVDIMFLSMMNLNASFFSFLKNELQIEDETLKLIKLDYTENSIRRNMTNFNNRKKELLNLFKEQVKLNPAYNERIIKMYEADYNLINNINFYGQK